MKVSDQPGCPSAWAQWQLGFPQRRWVRAREPGRASEGIWKTLRLKGTPPVTRLAYWLSAQECTIDISRARSDLGYQPVKDQATGLAEMRQATAA